MQIKIVFGNNSLDNKFCTGWGVSYLINNNILFDTGGRPSLLFNNIDKIGIKIPDLDSVVISHDHWDHTGGLWPILEDNPKIKIYSCLGFKNKFKDKTKLYNNRFIEIDAFTEISKNIYSTGSLEGEYNSEKIYEQSLILKTKKGLTIITGCAHPGIINIIEYIKKNLSDNIHLVMGGFHLQHKSDNEIKTIINKFKKFNIKLVGACHCTGEKAKQMFKDKYKNNFIDINIGELLNI